MKTNNIISANRLSVFVLLVIITSCKELKYSTSKYELNDVPHRNIFLEFKKNGEVFYGNNTNYGWAFWGNCTWKFVNDKTILILNMGIKDTINYRLASLQYQPINQDSALFDHRYIFPLLYNDTIRFSDNLKTATLKGYIFKWNKHSIRIDRLIKESKENK